MSADAEKGSDRLKIICISGKAGHGKDTVASMMKEIMESERHNVLVTHYGDLVKYVCRTFFDWDGIKDEEGRSLLQYIGTDVVKTQRPTYWIDFVKSILEMFPDYWEYILIPDCRFPDEIDALKEAGYDVVHVRVSRSAPVITSSSPENGGLKERLFARLKRTETASDQTYPLTDEQLNHISETALDEVLPDYIIDNSGSLDDLYDDVDMCVNDYIYELGRVPFGKYVGDDLEDEDDDPELFDDEDSTSEPEYQCHWREEDSDAEDDNT